MAPPGAKDLHPVQKEKHDEAKELFKGPPKDLKELPDHLRRIEDVFGKYGVKASTVIDGVEYTSADTMESLLSKQEAARKAGASGVAIPGSK